MKFLFVLITLLLVPFSYAQECGDCIYGNECIETGTQKIINEETFYCGEDQKLNEVKFFGTGCNNNYECISFYCNENKCDDLEFGNEFEEYSQSFYGKIDKIARNIDSLLFPLILVILLALLGIYIFLKGNNKKEDEKPKQNKIKYNKNKSSGKKHEELEKNIKRSFDEVKKTIK